MARTSVIASFFLAVVLATLLIFHLIERSRLSRENREQLESLSTSLTETLEAHEALRNSLELLLNESALSKDVGDETRLVENPSLISEAEHRQIVQYLMGKYLVAADQIKSLVLLHKAVLSGSAFHPKQSSSISPSPKECGNPRGIMFSVATLNLWNINPPWPERRQRIVAALRKENADVVGFQEIRYDGDQSQLDQIQENLKDLYPHRSYWKVRAEAKGSEEGIGFLSRFPILKSEEIVLAPRKEDPKNAGQESRFALKSTVEIPKFGPVVVTVAHITFIDSEQCNSYVQILRNLNNSPQEHPQVLMGDMNIYLDFEWPIELLTRRLDSFSVSEHNPCHERFQDLLRNEPTLAMTSGTFVDSYKQVHPAPDASGTTFSNFVDHRLEDPSRPDRILFRGSLDRTKAITTCESRLFATEAFLFENQKMYMSDHRGVLSTFALFHNE